MQVRDYFRAQFRDEEVHDEKKIMSHLSPMIRRRILRWNCHMLVAVVPMLRTLEEDAQALVTEALEPLMCFDGEVALSENAVQCGHLRDVATCAMWPPA